MKPVSAVTVGVPENVVGKPILICPPTGTAPTELKPAVQLALAPWTYDVELKLIDVNAEVKVKPDPLAVGPSTIVVPVSEYVVT